MTALIASLSHGVPDPLTELIALGRTLARRGRRLGLRRPPGTSTGPTETIKGRLDQLRGFALRVRKLTDCIARSPLETGEFETVIRLKF